MLMALPKGQSAMAANAARLQAAGAAREQIAEFLDALAHPKAGQRFAIKGRFTTSLGPEYMWVKDPTFDGKTFTGTLDQVPIVYTEHRKGEQVKVAKADVYDWLIGDADGTQRGGYTEKAGR